MYLISIVMNFFWEKKMSVLVMELYTLKRTNLGIKKGRSIDKLNLSIDEM